MEEKDCALAATVANAATEQVLKRSVGIGANTRLYHKSTLFMASAPAATLVSPPTKPVSVSAPVPGSAAASPHRCDPRRPVPATRWLAENRAPRASRFRAAVSPAAPGTTFRPPPRRAENSGARAPHPAARRNRPHTPRQEKTAPAGFPESR